LTPQTAGFAAKAQKLLADADTMMNVALHEAAGRTACLAGFHIAQAFIFERTGKVLKTHHGVQAEFQRLTKDEARMDPNLRLFLSRTYNLKAIADYETGPGARFPRCARQRLSQAATNSSRILPT
jgi:uncharacterized protein (UPF0332 family)